MLSSNSHRDTCHLDVGEDRIGAGEVRRWATATLPNGETITTNWLIRGPSDAMPSTMRRADFALIAFIFRAMHHGANLHVRAPVSRSLLENLEEHIAIWSLWRPDLYKRIAVSADAEIDDPASTPQRARSAVVAFSGGVDATYSVHNHLSGNAGRHARDLIAGIVVHGFDILLNRDDHFATVFNATSKTLADVNIPAVQVKCDWKTTARVDWEMEFAAGILSCLQCWSDEAATMVMGSCEDYARLVTPWGSHPLPTRLLAPQSMRILYDGGDKTRCAKVGALAAWPAGFDALRVCWQGDHGGENCGRCEKCIRTKLNAIASGVRLPASLHEEPSRSDVVRLGPFNSGQRMLALEIFDVAKANNIRHARIRDLRLALSLSRFRGIPKIPRSLAKKARGSYRAWKAAVGSR